MAPCSKPLLFSSREVLLIVFCSATVHLFNFYGDLHLLSDIYYVRYLYFLVTVLQGVVFISFPLLGLAGDTLLNRHRAVSLGVLLAFVASTLIGILAVVAIATDSYQDPGGGQGGSSDTSSGQDAAFVACYVTAGFCLLIGSLGEALLEANAIQFAADQLMDAPSVEVSAMIHWYCWARLFFHTVFYNIDGALLLYCSHIACKPIYVLLYTSLVGVVLSGTSLALLVARRRRFYVHPRIPNPLSQVFRVLAYAKSHPQPVRRSAFTYCDNRPPSRLDFGKQRFGGPFTNEQVEDTRVFLWMCLLISTLVGYDLAGDTFLFGSWLESKGYSSRASCLLFGIDTENFSHLVVLVGVPVHQLIVVPRTRSFDTGMLRRIGVGLISTLTAALSVAFIEAMIATSPPSNIVSHNCSALVLDTYANVSNLTSDAPTYLHVLAVPQFFQGVAYMLVFITTLEFICAQAPNALKGTLIGLWYSLQGLQYLLVGLLDQIQLHHALVETTGWYVYQISKALAILVSVFLFLMVGDRYRYRQRGDEYYEKLVIEDIYDRELDRAEHHEEEFSHFIHANPCRIYSGVRHW